MEVPENEYIPQDTHRKGTIAVAIILIRNNTALFFIFFK